MKDLNETLKEMDEGAQDAQDVTDFILERFEKACKRDPSHALAMLSFTARTIGAVLPALVETHNPAQMHMEMIRSLSEGLKIGIETAGGSVEVKIVKL